MGFPWRAVSAFTFFYLLVSTYNQEQQTLQRLLAVNVNDFKSFLKCDCVCAWVIVSLLMSIFMQSAPRNRVLINRHNSVAMFDMKGGTTNASVIHSMAVLIVNTVSITVPPVWGKHSLHPTDIDSVTVGDIVRFIRKSHRFSSSIQWQLESHWGWLMDPHRGLSLRGDATNALPLLEPEPDRCTTDSDFNSLTRTIEPLQYVWMNTAKAHSH